MGPDFVNWPTVNSRKNNGSAPNISIVVYGIRKTPRQIILTYFILMFFRIKKRFWILVIIQ